MKVKQHVIVFQILTFVRKSIMRKAQQCLFLETRTENNKIIVNGNCKAKFYVNWAQLKASGTWEAPSPRTAARQISTSGSRQQQRRWLD